MLGKQKCRILKEIRQRIADENDIPYVTRECGFKGECRGTCPRCESELRYLEKQLALRASLGKKVAVAALCAGMSFSAAACSPAVTKLVEPDDLSGAVAWTDAEPTPTPEIFVTEGEVAWPEDDGEIEAGEIQTEDLTELPPEPIGDEDDIAGGLVYIGPSGEG